MDTPLTPPHFSSQLTPPPGGNFFPASSTSSPSSGKPRARANSMNHLNPPNVHHLNAGNKTESGTLRRWSMGAHGNPASVQTERPDTSGNITGPGPPRRWSVPEANEPPPPQAVAYQSMNTLNPWSMATPWVTHPGMAEEANRRLSVPAPAGSSSRESSAGGTRSNSHSRSATPEAVKLFMSTEELDDLVDVVTSSSDKGGRSSSVRQARSDSAGSGSERKSPCQHHHKGTSSCSKQSKAKHSEACQTNTAKKESESVQTHLEPKPPDDKGSTKPRSSAVSCHKKSVSYAKSQSSQPKHKSYHHHYLNKPTNNFNNHQQYQLQQYLYQQQMQASAAHSKLSPISSSILRQQQLSANNYMSILQQQIYQQRLHQNLKFQQSLQMLQLQQQQQHKFGQLQPQQRKNSLQNLGSYYHEFAPVYYYETPDDSSCSNSRRGSSNTTISSCSSAGGPGRTPVIPEASAESCDTTSDAASTSHKWQKNPPPPPVTLKAPTIQMEGKTVNAPTLPEVVTTSTPLWPPSGSVPGVTLTECVEEFRNIPSDRERWGVQPPQVAGRLTQIVSLM